MKTTNYTNTVYLKHKLRTKSVKHLFKQNIFYKHINMYMHKECQINTYIISVSLICHGKYPNKPLSLPNFIINSGSGMLMASKNRE